MKPEDWLFWGNRGDRERLKKRAEARGYKPPPLKYHSELKRDVTELLLDPEKTAFINVDSQNAFADPKGKHYCGGKTASTIVKINELVKYFREHNMPIIWALFTPEAWNLGLMAKYWPLSAPPKHYCKEGTWEWRHHADLDARPEDIYVKKPKYDAFWGSNLEAVLRSLGVRCLVFTGHATDVCVGQTMVHGMHLDYTCAQAQDGCSTFSNEEAWLSNAELLYCRVLTTDEIIAELEALKSEKGT